MNEYRISRHENHRFEHEVDPADIDELAYPFRDPPKASSGSPTDVRYVTFTGVSIYRREEWPGGHPDLLDGPTVVLYDSAGGLFQETWVVDGFASRTDGPAVKLWSTIAGQSSVQESLWFTDGWLHREDGPAVERELRFDEWWLEGTKLDERTHGIVRDLVREGAPLEWALAYAEGATS